MSEANFPNEITSPRLTTLFGWTGNLVDTPIAGQVRMYYNYGTNLVEAVDPNGSAITFASAGGGGILQSATVTLSAAQLLSISETNVPIVPATLVPAVLGKTLLPVFAFGVFRPGDSAYTGNLKFEIYLEGQNGQGDDFPEATLLSDVLQNLAANNLKTINFATNNVCHNSDAVGRAIVVANGYSDPTGGNGTVDITIGWAEF